MTYFDWIALSACTAAVVASVVAYTAARHAYRSARVILNVQRVMDEHRCQRVAANIQSRVTRPRPPATPGAPAGSDWATRPTDPQRPIDTRTGFRPPPRTTPGQAG